MGLKQVCIRFQRVRISIPAAPSKHEVGEIQPHSEGRKLLLSSEEECRLVFISVLNTAMSKQQ